MFDIYFDIINILVDKLITILTYPELYTGCG